MFADTIKVISRNSPLALEQVREVFAFFPGLKYELITVESFGDKNKEISLLDDPPTDLFTRELDEAVLQDIASVAVHSAKDLPYPLPSGLEVMSLFEAMDQTDSLVSRQNLTLAQLPEGAKVGTSSPTRRKELLAIRTDVKVVSVRGTIKERVALIDSGTIDALIVASCALGRLGLSDRAAEVLPFETHPLQGNLAIVGRTDNLGIKSLFSNKDIRRKYGKVALVGFGPGNPDLLTLGGDKALSQADIIFHDDLLDQNYLSKYKAEKCFVGKRKDKHSFEQNSINRLLLDAARAGKQVVRLKGGDPMVFAHGGEEIEYLQSNFIEVTVVPGVTTGVAVAALTKIPLTYRGIASSVGFVTGHSEDVYIPDNDTLVFFMGGSKVSHIAQKAIEKGRNPSMPVMLVHNVSLPDQQGFFGTLESLSHSDIKYPSPLIIVIGDVVSLRNNCGKAIEKPTILVTGTQKGDYGKFGTVVHQPLVQIEEIVPNPQLDGYISQIGQFDWLFFTSRYSVDIFFKTLYKNGKDVRSLAHLKIASVGNITSKALNKRGIVPDLQPGNESSEGLIQEIMAKGIIKGKALIPRSDIGLPLLPEGLEKLGWEITATSVYRNIFPEGLKKFDLSKVKKIVFSSPSCVTNFARLYGHLPADKQYIFRGKETEKRFLELYKNTDKQKYIL